MSNPERVVVLGASGFVGSATCLALERLGMKVLRLSAPRLPGTTLDAAADCVVSESQVVERLAEQFRGARAVVNAAGNPDASSRDLPALVAANAALPGLVASAVVSAGVARFVHISSAVVQGRRPVLDETDRYDTFSDYARSKALGEELAVRFGDGATVVYRPPSVHGPDRRVTKLTARIAASPVGTVARPGSAPSPQAHIANVAEAVAYLATTAQVPPSVVIHPWEGLTTADVLELLGRRRPVELPRPIARLSVRGLELLGRMLPSVAANARRIEMLWFGQRQARSWLTDSGWSPPAGREAWTELGDFVLRSSSRSAETTRRSKNG
ncbi:NAD-dependent epimerase/dehydratase family protein [Georgenia sp. SUBG003]|uniref:NAD-dependent epimerase/dehydratase family protein n=1 Tax=Georgenia sp. SUBG003 TaxID=1497974 RepID=UPI003AB15D21